MNYAKIKAKSEKQKKRVNPNIPFIRAVSYAYAYANHKDFQNHLLDNPRMARNTARITAL